MPLSICVSVFVFSSGPGWSGHSSGHQVRRQHPQGLRYVTLHHPVNADIVLLAAGLWPNQVKKAVAIFFSVFSFLLFFLSAQWVFCSCLQCFLPRGRFSHRGHFPVRLRRQAFPQSQQGVGHTAETTAAAGGREDTKGKEDWTAFMFSHIVWKHNGGCKQVWIRGRFVLFFFNFITTLWQVSHQKCLSWEGEARRDETRRAFYFSSVITTAHIIQLPRPVKGNWTDWLSSPGTSLTAC